MVSSSAIIFGCFISVKGLHHIFFEGQQNAFAGFSKGSKMLLSDFY
jgi:hypothetical protein